MAIEFSCPACGETLRVADDAAGTAIRCGGCMSPLRVPAAAPSWEADPDNRPDDHRDDRDDRADDESRPRRRRRPPPPPGRGALFWIMMVFGGLTLGCCGCCGGIYLLLPGEQWRSHESREGRFKVDLPAPVSKNMPIPGMKADPNMKVEGTMLWKRGEFYAVMYWEIPADAGQDLNDQAILDETVRGMQADPEIKRIVRNEPITVSGYKGREVEYLFSDGGTYVGRLVIADRRLFVLAGGGRFVKPGNANIRRFLNSFEVTGKPAKPPVRPPDEDGD